MKYLLKYDAVQYDGSEESIDAIRELVPDLVVNEDETLSFISGSESVIVSSTDWVVKFLMGSCYVFADADFNNKFQAAT